MKKELEDEEKKFSEQFVEFIKAFAETISPKTKEELLKMEHLWINQETRPVIEKIFSQYFNMIEGSSCSSDKASFVSSRLIRSCKSGEVLNLRETYREYQEKGVNIGSIGKDDPAELDKVAYWCPKTLDNTYDAFLVLDEIVHLKFDKFHKRIEKYFKNQNIE